ncbi:hypothetical protein P618_200402 [Holospora obtusa F1]|uniref:Uncharacterized protein n=1 Tax=Holospora obtusa F1 TaxID=1399147 RepID=W6TUL9_HOLOB|nr:hypothetical protein P618_200402 [Holospora obtusa F1]
MILGDLKYPKIKVIDGAVEKRVVKSSSIEQKASTVFSLTSRTLNLGSLELNHA